MRAIDRCCSGARWLPSGCLEDALAALSRSGQQGNVVAWTNLIAAFSRRGDHGSSLELFWRMQSENVKPDCVAFITALNVCGTCSDLSQGKRIHALLGSGAFTLDVALQNALVSMYGKCGSVENSQAVFHKMEQRNLISWTAMISAYAQNGHFADAQRTYRKILVEGVSPCQIAFLAILKACVDVHSLRPVHACIYEGGYESQVPVVNALLSMYLYCRSLVDVQQIFSRMSGRDVITWTTMIAANTQCGECNEAMVVFRKMLLDAVVPNKNTLVTALSACEVLSEGKTIHQMVVSVGLQGEVILQNALLKMYGKCGSPENAWEVFARMRRKEVIAWTSMVSAYVRSGDNKNGFLVFRHMQLEKDVVADMVTFITVLAACTSLADGELVHQCMKEAGVESYTAAGTALIDMYGRFSSSLENAELVFRGIRRRDVVAWTVFIAACIQHGNYKKALEVFHQMKAENVHPDINSLLSAINACAFLGDLAEGEQIRAQIMGMGLYTDVVASNALMNLYVKCGELEVARGMFERMHERNEVSWNTILGGYARAGNCTEVFQLFDRMKKDQVCPNSITYTTVLEACEGLSALPRVREVHALLEEEKLDTDSVVATALLRTYGKCGALKDAQLVFEKLRNQNSVSWSAMAATYAQHGQSELTLKLVSQMQQEGVMPDGVTFVTVLSICGHAGLVHEAFRFFWSMQHDYGIALLSDHYCCMIDMLGRLGWLHEAEEFITRMAVRPEAPDWSSLLSACVTHGDIERGKLVARQLVKHDPGNSLAYVTLSRLYAVSVDAQN